MVRPRRNVGPPDWPQRAAKGYAAKGSSAKGRKGLSRKGPQRAKPQRAAKGYAAKGSSSCIRVARHQSLGVYRGFGPS